MHTQTHPTAPTGASCAVVCTATTPPLPGQHWPQQNGYYAGIMRSEDGLSGWHLVLPDGDEYQLDDVKWGKVGQDVAGASNRFDGYANTLAMAAAGSPLAKKVRRLAGDCHIPSRAEAALIFAILPDRLKAGYHWTSTQYSADGAWLQYFGYGFQDGNGKSYEARCRAVRRLLLQSFIPSEGVGSGSGE